MNEWKLLLRTWVTTPTKASLHKDQALTFESEEQAVDYMLRHNLIYCEPVEEPRDE